MPNIHIDATYQTVFDVAARRPTAGHGALQIPGEFNVLNALAALIVARSSGRALRRRGAALASFQGAGRRFQARGEVNGVLVIDDYAHHPDRHPGQPEGGQTALSERKIWAVWQPHTYSRTQASVGWLRQALSRPLIMCW